MGEASVTFVDQLRDLDPNDPSRWPLPFRLGAIAVDFRGRRQLDVVFPGVEGQEAGTRFARAVRKPSCCKRWKPKARKAANLDDYKAQLAEMERSFGAMLRKLPDKTEVPNLLTDISQQGAVPVWIRSCSSRRRRSTRISMPSCRSRCGSRGSYHAIGAFVSGIAALPRIVTLHDVEIVPASKETGNDQLQLNVTAKTYRYLDEEEQAAQEPSRCKERVAGKREAARPPKASNAAPSG